MIKTTITTSIYPDEALIKIFDKVETRRTVFNKTKSVKRLKKSKFYNKLISKTLEIILRPIHCLTHKMRRTRSGSVR